MIRILVTGDRNWKDVSLIRVSLICARGYFGEIEVIEGEAPGADTIARQVCEEFGWKFRAFPADWDTHGRAAGPIRNKQMLNEGKPHFVLAFHLDIEHSKGTKNMVEQSRKTGIPVWICTEGPDALLDMFKRKDAQHGLFT
jgi:hypothetical protein